MNYSFLFMYIVHLIYESPQDKCCEQCFEPTEKYYSIPKNQPNNCGECCIDPNDYDRFKRFEPDLLKANTSTPCDHFGYGVYLETETHGAGPVKVELDLYTKTQ